MYRDISSSGASAAKIFKTDGSSTPFYPLVDIAEAWSLSVWGVAATPDGGIVLSVIPVYSAPGVRPPKVKSLLLTYNGAGKLANVLDTDPYLYHSVAVDRFGNIFAFGESDLDDPYPLIVKYSPSGSIEKKFLSSADIPGSDFAIWCCSSQNGEPDMFIKGDEIFVWLSHSRNLLRFSLAGDLISKTSLAPAFNDLAAATNSDHTSVRCLTTGEQGEIFAQVQLWPKDTSKPVPVLMIQIQPDGSKATIVASPPGFTFFLGKTDQGKMIFFEPQPEWKGGTLSEF
jgi:hypothetical protein